MSSEQSENYANIVHMASMRCPRRPCKQHTIENYMSRAIESMAGLVRIHTIFEDYEIVEVRFILANTFPI